MDPWINTALVGIGATALTDLWSLARRAMFGVPPPDDGRVGRWLAHMARGRFRHASIAAAAPLAGERIVGWAAHYLIGVGFAALMPGLFGTAWLREPTLAPAMAVGIGTVAAPFLLMQPGMGAGIAARLTPHPNRARLHSLAMHAVFGLGMYASAWATAFIAGY